MVRGLVEEEEIGTEEEEPREGGPHAPAARKFLERTMRVLRGEAEAAQDDLGLRLQPIAAQRLEAMLHVTVALGGGLGRRRIRHEDGEALQLGFETPDLVEAGERL